MIRLLILLLPLLSFGQFYKYSTIYFGGSINATMSPIENYQYIGNELIETTNNDGDNYRYFIGIKKVSRYKFEKKPKYYYDGLEKNASVFRSPVDRLEYLFQYERIKDRGSEYENRKIWLRYLGNRFSIKLEESVNGYVDLSYKALDVRFKHDISGFRATLGGVVRNAPIYNVNAFKRDYPNYNQFDSVAYELGYESEWYYIDQNNNGHYDRMEDSYYRWTNEGGDTVATNTEQFKNYYANMVSIYNKDWVAEQGNQNTISAVVGLSYYKHLDKFFILAYGNYFFINKKLTDYGSETMDYDYGLILNYKLTRSLSCYTQLEYLNYFNRENYTINLGINFIII